MVRSTSLLSIAMTLLAVPATAQVQGGNGPAPPRPPRPEIQPPRPGPEVQPPRPPRPEIQPPRPGPEIQPPRPPRPQPPRPPILPPVVRHQIALYPGLALIGRAQTFSGSISDLRRYGIADHALSLRATGRWQACTRTKYRGHCETFSGRVLNLSRYGLARRVYSVRYLGP